MKIDKSSPSGLIQMRQVLISDLQRNLFEAYGEVKNRLSKLRVPQSLANPNLPAILEDGLAKLARLILQNSKWSIAIGERIIASNHNMGESALSPAVHAGFGGISVLTPDTVMTSQVTDFLTVSEGLIRLTVDLQKELLKSVVPAKGRSLDDDAYSPFLERADAAGLKLAINLSDMNTGLSRILSGPYTVRRFVDQLTTDEILSPDILPSLDLICNWGFSFQQTNTSLAIEAKREHGQSSLHFPDWWASGAQFFGSPDQFIANTLQKAMRSEALFGKADYLLTPFHDMGAHSFTLASRGATVEDMKDILEFDRPMIAPNSIPWLPSHAGYQAYGSSSWSLIEAFAKVLGGLSESPYLYEKRHEPEVNQHFAERLALYLDERSGWSVSSEARYGMGRSSGGHPDILIRFMGPPPCSIVCECKWLDNIRGVVRQIYGYIRPTTSAVFLVAYQARKDKDSWKSFLAAIREEAGSLQIGMEPVSDVAVAAGSVLIGSSFLYPVVGSIKAIPFYLFLVDLASTQGLLGSSTVEEVSRARRSPGEEG